MYRGNNPTPITTLNGLSNTNSLTYSLASGDNNITLVTNANTGIVLSNAGLRFVAPGGQKFYVNYRGRSNAQGTSLTSKGKQALGTEFRWGGIPNRATNTNLSSTLGILATQNGTQVTVSGYDPGVEFRVGNNRGGLTDNSYTINLNAGQSFVFEAAKNETPANVDGFIGALITSNLPIAISNGYLNAGVRTGTQSRDAGIDQPVPTNVLGREYVFVRGNGTNETEFPLIIATSDNTDIFVNGSASPIATINNGDYFIIPGSNYSSNSIGANMFVTTSKEVYAYQNLAGSSAIQTIGFNFIAPVNCLLPDNLNNIPNIRNVAGLNFNGGVTIVASATTPDINISVTDGTGDVPLPPSSPAPGTSDWKTFYIGGLQGDVSVQSTGPIAVGFLGVSGNAGIAGYFSGFDTVPVVELEVGGGGCLPGSVLQEATGGFDAYQWFQNGMPIPGAVMSSYTPDPNVGFADYFVRVTKGTCTYDSAILTAYNCDPDVVLNKTADPGPYLPGDTIDFTITIQSRGIDPVTNVVVNDLLPEGLSFSAATVSKGTFSYPNWTVGDMAQGEVETLTLTATADSTPPGTTTLSLTNTATNTQDQTDSNFTSDDPSATITVTPASILAEKSTLPAADGSYDSIGEEVSYEVVVTNSGAVPVSNVTVTDPIAASITPSSVANLAPGATATFTITHFITQAEFDAKQVVNQAIAQAELLNNTEISDESDDPDNPDDIPDSNGDPGDPTITPINNPELTIEKTVDTAPNDYTDNDGDGQVSAGDAINYILTVTNTGNIDITDIILSDPGSSIAAPGPFDLAVGDPAYQTSASHTLTQTEIDSGQYANQATATFDNPINPGTEIETLSDDPNTTQFQDPTIFTIPQIAAIIITKVDNYNDTSEIGITEVGETIDYTFTITNTGNITINDIMVSDPDVSITGGPISLGGGESDTSTFTGTYTITQDDINTGTFTNQAIVTGVDANAQNVSDQSDDPDDPTDTLDDDGDPGDPTITTLLQNSTITVLKEDTFNDENNDTFVQANETITYNFTVTNTGNTTISDITITDPNVTVEGGPIDLEPGVSVSNVFTATYTITQADIDTGSFSNQATANGNDPQGNPVGPILSDDPDDNTSDMDATVTTFVPNNTFTVNKVDVPAADGSYDTVDEVITYTITVTNTGSQTLDAITPIDANADAITPASTDNLAPGASFDFTATHAITQNDLNNGSITNSASVTAEDPSNNTVGPVISDDPDDLSNVDNDGDGNPDDDTVTSLDQTPELVLEKTAIITDGGDGLQAGDTIEYTFSVTNSGNVEITGTVIDDATIGVTGLAVTPNLLTPNAPNNIGTATFEYTITQDDIDSGMVTNQATTTGQDPNGMDVTDMSDDPDTPTNDDATITVLPQISAFTVTKVDNGGPFNTVGQTINYTITITNTGNTTLSNISITDPNVDTGSISPATIATLDAGEFVEVTAAHTLTQDDIDAGTFSNQATVAAQDPQENPIGPIMSDDPDDNTSDMDPTITTIDQVSDLDIFKVDTFNDENGDGMPQADETITYNFTVTNIGNTTITNIDITEQTGVSILGGPIDLDPSETNTAAFVGTYLITQADIDTGSFANQATVNGDDPQGNPVGPIVSDDPNDNTSDMDPTITTLNGVPMIELEKTGTWNDDNANGISDVGETVNYTFHIINTGNVTVHDISVTDPLPGISISGTPITLLPGENDNTTFTATYQLTQNDINNGNVINTATATGTFNGTLVVDDSDDPTTTTPNDATTTVLARNPDIALGKIGIFNDENGDGIPQANETVDYQFFVVNTGNVTLTNITITDPKVTVLGGPLASLDPLEEDNTTFSATYTITQDDIDNGGITNTATVTGEDNSNGVITTESDFSDDPNNPNNEDLDGDGDPDDPTVTSLPSTPAISILKVGTFNDENADGLAQVDETISYTFQVTNTGNITLNNLVVNDPLVAVEGDPITLTPGESDTTTFTATYTITQSNIDAGVIENQATVSGTDPNGTVVMDTSDDPNNPTDSDANGDGEPDDVTATTLPIDSQIQITKAANLNDDIIGNGIGDAGETIDYTITVTNTGNTTISSITVSDPLIATPGSITLMPGESDSTTFSVSHTLTQDDIDAGMVTNQATTNGTDSLGNSVTDISDDPNNPTNNDIDGDGDPDDPTETTINTSPMLQLTKEAIFNDENSDGFAQANETITYLFEVTNTGNVTINNVIVTDPVVTVMGDPIEMSPNEVDTTSFTATYTITQTDVDAGSFTNTATVTGTDPQNNTITDDSDDPTTTDPNDPTVTQLAQNSDIQITKASDPATDGAYDTTGEVITYTLVVTNSGNTTLTNVEITDANADPGSISPATIATLGPAETTTVTAAHTITQAELDSGSFSNQAMVTANDPNNDPVMDDSDDPNNPTDNDDNGDGNPDDITETTFVQTPSLSVTKVSDAGPFTMPDDVITYTIVVTNTGNTTLTNIDITDANADTGSITPATITTLLPGDSETVTATHTVTQEDIDAGTVSNQATATGEDTNGNPITDDSDDPNDPTDNDTNGDGEPDDITITTIDQTSSYTVVKTDLPATDGAYDTVGEVITYTITVTNTGNTTLNNLVVSDPTADAINPSTITTLNAGASIDITATHAITVTDLNIGEVTNDATVTADDPNGDPVGPVRSDDPDDLSDIDDDGDGNPDDTTVTTLVANPEITFSKIGTFQDQSGDGIAQVGETIQYTFTVRNTGNQTVTNIMVADPLPGIVINGGPINLDPEEVNNTSFTGFYILTLADVNSGNVTNQATATGQDPNGVDVSDESDDPTTTDPNDPTVTTLATDPKISLQKEGEFNDENNDGFAQEGETITYTFTVTNTGNVTITDITVTDALIATPGSIDLDPGDVDNTTFVVPYTITQADADNGSIINTATASGNDPMNNPVTDNSDNPNDPTNVDDDGDGDPDDDTVTTLPSNPAISVLKQDMFNDENTDGLPQAGETISYLFTVTNTGNQTLTNVTVSDPKVTVNGGPVTLAPDDIDTTTFTATYTILQADIDSGMFSNQATVSGLDPNNNSVSDASDDPDNFDNVDPDGDGNPDDPTISMLENDSDISITKSQAPGTFDSVGDIITYNIVVSNTGNTTLSNVTVVDENADTITPATIASILPRNSVPVTATHTITQEDLDNGSVTNTAVVSGTDPNGDLITDDSDDPNNPTDIDPDGDGDPDDPTVTMVTQTPSIDLTKATNPGTFNSVGDIITYTIEVINNGNVTVTNIQITDDNADSITPAFIDTIAPGTTVTISATHIVTQADIDAGSVINTAIALGEDPNGDPVGPVNSDDPTTPAQDDPTITTIDQSISYTVSKSDLPAADGTYDMVGETISYEIIITNTGNTTVSNFVITDDNADTITPSTIATIAPSDFVTVIATHNLTQDDLDAGVVNNSATVTADSSNGNPAGPIISDDPDLPGNNDVTTTPINQTPNISITKAQNAPADGAYDTIDEDIVYTIAVTNTGNVTLTNVEVTDSGADSISPSTIATLDPNETVIVTASHAITQTDIDAGFYTNTATVTGDDPGGMQVSDDSDDPNNSTDVDPDNDGDPDDPTTTSIDQTDSFIVEKTFDNPIDGSYDTVGELITYTILITNTGTTTLSDIVVMDENATITSGLPIATLAPGTSATVKAEHAITQEDLDEGMVVNVAVANGNDPQGNAIGPVSSDDPTTSDPGDPTITTLDENGSLNFTKAITSSGPYDAVGQQVIYEMILTNDGNVTLTNLIIGDNNADSVTPSSVSVLAPGESITAVAVHTVTQEDLDTGFITNQATVTSTSPQGNQVTETSDDPNDPTNIDPDIDGDSDDPTVVTTVQNADISIIKSDNPATDGAYDTIGEEISYTIEVTNTGNVTLTNVEITDPGADSINPSIITSLDSGETVTIVAIHAITQADIDAGFYANTATVTGNDTEGMEVSDDSDDPDNPTNVDPDNDGNPDDPTITNVEQTDAFIIEKSFDAPVDGSYDTVGELITYTIVVTNTGTTTLSNIIIRDENAVITSGSPIISLIPGASATVTAEHAITQEDLNQGTVVNVAVGRGNDPQGNTVGQVFSDDPTTSEPGDPTVTELDQTGSLELTKAVTSSGPYNSIGQQVTYDIILTNNGNVLLRNLDIEDPNADSVTPSSVSILAPGETITAVAVHTVTQEDLDAGSISNQVTVTSTLPQGNEIVETSDDPNDPTDTDPDNDGDPDDPTIVNTTQDPDISITKSDDPPTDGAYDTVGEVIMYSIVVSNTGNETLSDITISDPNADAGSINPSFIATLGPGQNVTATAAHTITEEDLIAGQVINTATVSGVDNDGNSVTDDSDDPDDPTNVDPDGDGDPDDSTVTELIPINMFAVTKEALDTNYTMVGDIISYEIIITNTGSTTLRNVQVSDPNAVIVSGTPIQDIDPGASASVIAEHTITQADIDATFVDNQATVTADVTGINITVLSDDPNDPTNQDSDGDGNPDDITTVISGADSDGDGVSDADELADGTDPKDTCDFISGSVTLPQTGEYLTEDCDGDGVLNGDEISDGTDPFDECSYNFNSVTVDFDEPFLSADCDGDGFLNGDELGDENNDGIPDYDQANNGNPNEELQIFDIMTPDGDGVNDVFVIKGIQKFPNNTLKIFNRWGVKVYEAKGYGQNGRFFNGTSNGRVTISQDTSLPVGTYYYVLEYVNATGETKKLAGPLYINRR